MDAETRTLVTDALRLAKRALTVDVDQDWQSVVTQALDIAERSLALRRAPAAEPLADGEPASSVVQVVREKPRSLPKGWPLLDFISGSVLAAKKAQETRPGWFRDELAKLALDLLTPALERRSVCVGPKGTSIVSPEPAPALSALGKLLKVMTDTKLDTRALVGARATNPAVKTWGDLVPETEYVLLRYETPDLVEVALDARKLRPLVEEAKKKAGLVEKTVASLRDAGVVWDAPTASVTTDAIRARWVAVLDVQRLADDAASQLAVVKISAVEAPTWWAAARASAAMPQAALPVVRGKQQVVFVQKSDASAIELWAESLPDWTSETRDAHPLVIHDITHDDILA